MLSVINRDSFRQRVALRRLHNPVLAPARRRGRQPELFTDKTRIIKLMVVKEKRYVEIL